MTVFVAKLSVLSICMSVCMKRLTNIMFTWSDDFFTEHKHYKKKLYSYVYVPYWSGFVFWNLSTFVINMHWYSLLFVYSKQLNYTHACLNQTYTVVVCKAWTWKRGCLFTKPLEVTILGNYKWMQQCVK